eukprot:1095284-Lingulodinium_polyedra.AAC.1
MAAWAKPQVPLHCPAWRPSCTPRSLGRRRPWGSKVLPWVCGAKSKIDVGIDSSVAAGLIQTE